MSLIDALNIGKSALATHQAAIQVTSNNVANAGNPDYTRQVARTLPNRDQQVAAGIRIGTGVNLAAVERQIDEALEGRIRGSISDAESAQVRQEWVGSIEAVFRELGDDDLSTQLSEFFGSWSNLAGAPQDVARREAVVRQGESLAASIRDMRTQLTGLQTDLGKRLAALASTADGLAEQVATLNAKIVAAEGGGGASANALRDQRDAALRSLSELLDIRVQDTGDGMVNVLVGSTPVVLGTTNRGLGLRTTSDGERLTASLACREDSASLRAASGQLGAALNLQQEIDDVVAQVDSLAGSLIFELNRIHSSGQGLEGFSSLTAGNAVNSSTAALNSDAAGLAFTPVNGSFVVHVRQSNGLLSSHLVEVDLDGQGAETTLESLRADLDGIDGIAATVSGGRLHLEAESAAGNIQISFSQDSSGALAALGVNSFFSGSDAQDIGVNADLRTRPRLLAAARNGQGGDNQAALAIAALETTPLAGLGGGTLQEKYESIVNGVAGSASSAKTAAEAAQTVRETLFAQRESLSGVSLDEEAINLMREQRAFQGAARVISAVDELMRVLLEMA